MPRLKRALFGGGKPPPSPPTGGGSSGSAPADVIADGRASPSATAPSETPAPDRPARRQGHGRRSAGVYSGAERVVCRHEPLAAGQSCPAWGRGTGYPLPAGVAIRMDGNALRSAVRYELEKLRCSACGAGFTAAAPATVEPEKYSPCARAVIGLGRYYWGWPFYRIEQYQALVGVPVADATWWDLAEQVADCTWPVFAALWDLAAQGEVIFQDDTHVRILALLAENRRADAAGDTLERRGRYPTGLVVHVEKRVLCLYRSGRAHAGDNLTDLLERRAPGQENPIVMSDALAANQRDDDDTLIRCHGLAHGRRQFTDLDEGFPAEARHGLTVLDQVFAHEAVARDQAMTPTERLIYHPVHSGPLLAALHAWVEQPFQDRLVEPNSSGGKAFPYLLNRWSTLTQFLRVAGAPIESKPVERALTRIIRQRKNSLFYASSPRATVASMLTSLIATCVQAGVNALEYLVT